MKEILASLASLKSLPRNSHVSAGMLSDVIEAIFKEISAQPQPTGKAQNDFTEMDDNETLGTKEVAELLHKSVSTIKQWRLKKDGGPKFQAGGHARYKVSDIKDWIDKNTVSSTKEAKGLSHFFLEGSTAFPVFLYEDGSKLSYEAAILYEEANPETYCESFVVVNMGDAWEQQRELYDGLTNNPESVEHILKNESIAKKFDISYWMFVQFIVGRLDSYQTLLNAIRMLVKHGTDINAQNNMTGYNLAHVLAISETGFVDENHFFNFMNHMLDMGMDVDLMNHENISGRDIAEQNDTEPSTSNFLAVLNKRDFANSLESKLSRK